MKRKMGKNEIITPEVETVHNRSESDTMPENGPLFVSQNTAFSPVILAPIRILVKPRKYNSPEQMQSVMESYFDSCDAKKKKYSVEGLALSLGFSSTESLREYGTGENYIAFHDLVKMAKLKIQMQRVEDLQAGELNPIAGIFLLSNCHRVDYQRDPESKENGGYKVDSFMAGYEAPAELKEQNDGKENTDDVEANVKTA